MINYIKTDWQSGDIITEAKMDNIENGLEAVINEINTINNINVKGTDMIFSVIGENAYINYNDGLPSTVSTATMWVTDYIYVSPDSKYMYSETCTLYRTLPVGWACYDSEKQFLEGTAYNQTPSPEVQNTIITLPSNARYVRFTIDESIVGNNFYIAPVETLTIKEYIDSKLAE